MKWTDDSLSRVDSSVHLIYHDLSDLGSLILSRIISKERTLGLWAGINAWQSPPWEVWPHRSDFNWNYILLINREWGHYRQISDREALMYWPNEGNGNTSRPRSEISLQWPNGRGQLVISVIWPFHHGLPQSACDQLKPTTGQQITSHLNELYTWTRDTVRWH